MNPNKFIAYRLTFTTPLHIDQRGTGELEAVDSYIQSDLLSAAILSAWAEIEPHHKEERFKHPPFRLSSAFPYFGDLYFLPRPMGSRSLSLSKEQLSENKKLKKTQWLEKTLWEQVVIDAKNLTKNDELVFLTDGLAVANTELQQTLAYLHQMDNNYRETIDSLVLWKKEILTRLAMNRLTGSSAERQLYDFARIWFAQYAGLYFLAQFDKQPDQLPFEGALSWLGDSGIGSDRNSGNGLFEWKKDDHFILQPNIKKAIALSVVIPDPSKDIQNGWLQGAAYELMRRRGWVTGTTRRKDSIRMFKEGSEFNQPLHGKVVELGKHPQYSYPIYRDGRGFFVGGEQ
jgi:CRISPR-associated protein Csm4